MKELGFWYPFAERITTDSILLQIWSLCNIERRLAAEPVVAVVSSVTSEGLKCREELPEMSEAPYVLLEEEFVVDPMFWVVPEGLFCDGIRNKWKSSPKSRSTGSFAEAYRWYAGEDELDVGVGEKG